MSESLRRRIGALEEKMGFREEYGVLTVKGHDLGNPKKVPAGSPVQGVVDPSDGMGAICMLYVMDKQKQHEIGELIRYLTREEAQTYLRDGTVPRRYSQQS